MSEEALSKKALALANAVRDGDYQDVTVDDDDDDDIKEALIAENFGSFKEDF